MERLDCRMNDCLRSLCLKMAVDTTKILYIVSYIVIEVTKYQHFECVLLLVSSCCPAMRQKLSCITFSSIFCGSTSRLPTVADTKSTQDCCTRREERHRRRNMHAKFKACDKVADSETGLMLLCMGSVILSRY